MCDIELVRQRLLCHGYELVHSIGKGGSATVFAVQEKNLGNVFVAKVILIESTEEQRMSRYKNEIKLLKKLDFSYIVSIFNYFYEDNMIFSILEYCPNGTLQDMIDKGQRIDLRQKVCYAEQIVRAIQFCHQRNIAHRDIKPANIFIDSYGRIKLGDFGIACSYYENDSLFNEFTGSLVFSAPELVLRKPHNPILADLWSLGITLYFLFYGNSPWGVNQYKEEVEQTIKSGNITFPRSSGKIVSFLSALIKVNPQDRATTDELLSFPIFQEPVKLTPASSQKNKVLVTSAYTLLKGKGYGTSSGSAHEQLSSLLDDNNNTCNHRNILKVKIPHSRLPKSASTNAKCD